MLRSILRALPLVSALILLPVAGVAQSQGIQPGDRLSVVVTFDGSPAADLPIELHHVTNLGAGVVAERQSDASGRAVFELTPDPAADSNVFFATAMKAGIRYFGSPVHSGSAAPETYTIEVFDTASSAPIPLRIPVRDVFLSPLPDGAWEVEDWVRISNDNRVTLTGRPEAPSFVFRIPEGATDLEVDEGTVLPNEVTLMEDRVMLLAPISPGLRELFVRYRLPARPTAANFAIAEQTDTMNLYVQQGSHLTEVIGLPRLSSIPFEGTNYMRYTGNDLEPSASVRISWSGALSSPVNPVVAAVVVSILLLAAGAIAAARNRGTVAPS